MPPRSEKHANFRRLAPARTDSVLEALRKLANLSSPNYEFADAEVEKIFSVIEESVEEARGRFRRDLSKRSRFTLDDLY
jgi:VIT1/CCC1 family predicted Fe2+/Mn2+ transporter